MRVTRVAAISVILASLGVGVLHAQNLRNVQPPAEFPPASYKGTQYVDSKGCVYIRAGIDGNVTWVPRVNRQRNLLCGQTPTRVAGGAPTAAPAAQAPVQITVAPPEAAPAKAQPAARVATKPAPKPKPKVTARRATVTAAATPQPAMPKVVTAPQPASPQTVAAPIHKPACPGASPISQRYINSGKRLPVRCGPQAINRGTGQQTKSVGPDTRVVPRHVYEQRLADTVTTVPNGYRAVWEDDRLNRRRAEQSLAGIAATRLLWTNTVPRRLIERSSGRDVTSTVPLVYPYTDMATQQSELGSVTIVNRNGLVMKRIVRNANAPVRQPTVSTRSAPAPVVKPKAQAQPSPDSTVAKGQYVQVGMFGNADNAQTAAQRLARTGLPARMGTLKRGDTSYRIVLAGPFDSPSKTARALAQARAAGFSDAFVRK